MHHSGIGCLSFQGDAGKPRNGSHPIQILGWRSLSGKVTHKVAHNDASISERNLKADSDHDQESFHIVIGSIARSGLCTITPRLFASV